MSSYLYDPDRYSLSKGKDMLGYYWCEIDWPDCRVITVRDEGSKDGFTNSSTWVGYVNGNEVATACATKEEAMRYCLRWAEENSTALMRADNDE